MKKDRIIFIVLIISFMFMSIGYATINSISAEVTGEVLAEAQDGIFITSVNYISGDEISESSSYYGTLLHSDIELSSNDDSYVTYEITIYNNTTLDYVFVGTTTDDEFYSNDEISYELTNIEVNDELDAYSYITLQIKFYYKENAYNGNSTLESYIKFKFSQLFTITYINIDDNNLSTYAIENQTLQLDLSNTASSVVGVYNDSEIITDYTYQDYLLTLDNVTSDITIINPYYETLEDDIVTGYYLTLQDAYSNTNSYDYEIRVLQNVTDDSYVLFYNTSKQVTLNMNECILTKTSYSIANMGTLNVSGGGIIDFDSTLFDASSYGIEEYGYGTVFGAGFVNMGYLIISDVSEVNYSDEDLVGSVYIGFLIGNMYGVVSLSNFFSNINTSIYGNVYGLFNTMGYMYINNLNVELDVLTEYSQYVALLSSTGGNFEVTGGTYLVNGNSTTNVRAVQAYNSGSDSTIILTDITAKAYNGGAIGILIAGSSEDYKMDVTIDGGSYYAESSNTAEGLAYYSDLDDSLDNDITTTIKGNATFTGNSSVYGCGLHSSTKVKQINIISGIFTGTTYGADFLAEIEDGVYIGVDDGTLDTTTPMFIGNIGIYNTVNINMYDGMLLGKSQAYAGSGTINVLDGYQLITSTTQYNSTTYYNTYLQN